MEYGLIAEHVGHSFSATIHGLIDNYEYTLREIPKDELDAFMRAKQFKGLNVTIPYKQAVIPYLDEVSDTAKAIGAVNTIVNRDGKLFGHNTDFGGLSALVRHMGLDLRGKKVLILGTGGTSKTAKAVAESMGAAEILKVSRSGSDGAVTYAEACRSHTDAEVIINTTPSGMFPNIDAQAIDLAPFAKLCGVVDVVFNPLRSSLVLAAQAKGVPAEGGLYMLVAQAVYAAECFTGKTYPTELIEKIYERLAVEKRNLVLIGMPACGKTTVGRAAAAALGREYIDLDELIVAQDGRAITEIFAQDGEAYFCAEETAAAKAVAGKTGVVIATGGGCPMREENVRFLKMNGALYFLDRPLESLVPTSDRPTADSLDKMRKLYETRYPKYAAAADVRIDCAKDVEEVLRLVLQSFLKENEA